jgi:hypothetical protein
MGWEEHNGPPTSHPLRWAREGALVNKQGQAAALLSRLQPNAMGIKQPSEPPPRIGPLGGPPPPPPRPARPHARPPTAPGVGRLGPPTCLSAQCKPPPRGTAPVEHRARIRQRATQGSASSSQHQTAFVLLSHFFLHASASPLPAPATPVHLQPSTYHSTQPSTHTGLAHPRRSPCLRPTAARFLLPQPL